MEELGCFPITADFVNAVHRPINGNPWPRKLIDVKFLLFTRNGPFEGFELRADDVARLRSSPFNSLLPTKFVIPGWLDNKLCAKWLRDIKDALLISGDYNVFLVQWNNFTPYFVAAANTRVVGAELSILLRFLNVTQSSSVKGIN